MFLRPAADWPAEPSRVRWGVPAVIGCLLAAQVAGILWFGVAAGLVYGEGAIPDEAPIWTRLLFNVGLWAGYLIGPIVVRRMTDSDGADFDLRVSGRELVPAAAVGVLSQIIILPALYFVVLRLMSGDPARTAEELIDRIGGPLDVIVLFVTVVLVGPVVEEWFYRGMLLPTLTRRFGAVAGVVGSSALFALVHQELILLPGLFVFAVILSWLTLSSGRIGPAVVAHMTFNASTLVLLLA